MAKARPVAVLDGVGKRFGRRGPWVLDGLDLTLVPGSHTAIVGANGCGKSTLLRIVAGASTPTTGRVRRPPAVVGYVPEWLPATLRMTATDYLAHMGRLRGMTEKAAAAAADAVLERLALRPGPDVPIGTLSKGNSQKVALAQAVLARPDLLVLDEPQSGLDQPARVALADLLGRLRSEGTAILRSGHGAQDDDSAEASYQLRDGRLWPLDTGAAGLWLRLRAVAADPVGLDTLPGVTVLTRDGAEQTLRAADADAVLQVALAGGWSLVEAR